MVRALLAIGADPSRAGFDGATAAHFAALRCPTDSLDALLDAAPHLVDSPDGFGKTPLMYAAQRQNELGALCCRLLLARGADARRTNNSGQAALHIAAAFGTPFAVRALLLAPGADPSAPTAGGWTAVHYVAAGDFGTSDIAGRPRPGPSERVGALRALLEAGADAAAICGGDGPGGQQVS